MTVPSISRYAEELADREAIRDCLYRYVRGSDRFDVELIESTFWPEATADYHIFKCDSRKEIVDKVVAANVSFEKCKHALGNMMIEINGDFAVMEAYCLGFKRTSREDGTRYERLTSSRYVDRFEKRNGEWRIIERLIVVDWAQEFPATDIGNDARKPHDGSYRFLSF